MDYVYATNRPWAVEAFLQKRNSLTGNWLLVTSPEDLEAILNFIKPKYLFFPHWSHIVPSKIISKYDCVCFHMTDLPYGRGGSPLQNLISRGVRNTKLTALKMIEELDAGPIYRQDELSLDGRAQKILAEMSLLAIEQIKYIITYNPDPLPQRVGNAEIFKRRKPVDSEIKKLESLTELYDHIRMLDASGYPTAYLDHGRFKYEYSNAKMSRKGDYLIANAKIRLTGTTKDEME